MATLQEAARQFEKDLGIREGFIESLSDVDDWSFIIKCHALLESAVSHVLTVAIGRPELADLFARIEMSNPQYGKAKFAEALGLLEKRHRQFIFAMSELRNDLVHDITNVEFDLKEWVNSKATDAKATKSLVLKFVVFLEESDLTAVIAESEGRKYDWRDSFRESPKFLISRSVTYLVAAIYKKRELAALAAKPGLSLGDLTRGRHPAYRSYVVEPILPPEEPTGRTKD